MNPQSPEFAATSASAGIRPQKGLHVFACILVVLTVGLIVAGAMVTSTGSGLSVPDWPTTYGENMFLFHPSKWVGGIFYEHSHRLFASTIGFLTIILAILAQIRGNRKSIRVLGWVALAVVIAQGVLGGMTVRFMLPTWISTFHACLAQTFLCILTTIAVLTHPRWETASARPARPLPLAPLVLVIVIFCQLLAGALMRHTESGLAVPDFPLAYNQVLPSLTDEAVTRYNDIRAFDYMMSPVTKSQIIAHLAHRVGAVLVVLAVIASVVSIRRNFRGDATANKAIAWIVLLVAIQATLGAYTIWTIKLALVATAHVAVGAATLGVAWRCFLLTKFADRRLPSTSVDRAAPLDNALIQGAVA
ncbi:MAG TPA: COX15/CtaA family protein [Phycisphaerae bacterium]|nr:COX15/CtaA family protein [Phycisphaerae bacterium]HRW55543.1 COX15/CtaA family protein [Phycisphaerae bacterium]